jgi:hypothetical protein
VMPFKGGYGLGLSPLWAPGKCFMYQDDLTAVASPFVFERFLSPLHARICSRYPHSFFHLHPASFMILDGLLNVDGLSVVQTQKEIGTGPSVVEMLPRLAGILEKKALFFSGDLTTGELDLLFESLRPQGLCIGLQPGTLEEARALTDHLRGLLARYEGNAARR